ncbi:GntR family transcriptional regulator [Tranquillimonas alkanivorans]|uniref:DNA-binding transcriptional regulator, GntR family n=1 Tax=Tranquillimonas alkanivorans TaxID=441119 RepID=A0A1I5VFA8_9RHOB|nr:GntR family transcriptional regulator [Tranquillimonas alkanivorans]SFQ06170.1 DNA-binding transcriptional regulator, GntR family [Tranquillimonas alkanivorans]
MRMRAPNSDETEHATHSASLRQTAYESIVDLLNSGALQPGQIISQRDLVARTGATLGSIREAIPRLEGEGLLQTLPKRGLKVPSLDVAFVRDAYQMRRMIELAAIPDVIHRLPATTIDGWIAWHEDAARRVEARQDLVREIQAHDWDMHEVLVAAMRNDLVARVYRVTAIKIRMAVQNRLRVTPDNARRVLAEHLAILYPLRTRNRAAAERALGRHLDVSLRLALGERSEAGGLS